MSSIEKQKKTTFLKAVVVDGKLYVSADKIVLIVILIVFIFLFWLYLEGWGQYIEAINWYQKSCNCANTLWG